MTDTPVPADIVADAARLAEDLRLGAAHACTGTGGLLLMRARRPSAIEAVLHQPLMCLILQGAKSNRAGDRETLARAGDAMVVSHATPVLSRIVEASPSRPYLAAILPLDFARMRRALDAIGEGEEPGDPLVSLRAAPAPAPLMAVIGRMLSAAFDPAAARALGPLQEEEALFHLLRSAHGAALRALLRGEGRAERVARVIAHIRANEARAIPAAELAEVAGMSASTLHAQFRAATATTPLQYQKDLRLMRARGMLAAGESVQAAAFAVGYESPTQFSREYARRFGAAPRDDRARLRGEAV